MGCFAWTLEAGNSAGNGNSKGRLLSSRCFPGQAQEMAKPACGHYRCGQKAEGRGAKMPVLSPDGFKLTQRHLARVLRAGEPVWEVHGQHQAAAQGTALRGARATQRHGWSPSSLLAGEGFHSQTSHLGSWKRAVNIHERDRTCMLLLLLALLLRSALTKSRQALLPTSSYTVVVRLLREEEEHCETSSENESSSPSSRKVAEPFFGFTWRRTPGFSQ